MGEIFGIGIEELIFIGILVALLLGPENLPKLARTAGVALNRLFRSPMYREGMKLRKQLNDLPSALARLAELEDIQKTLNSEISDLKKAIDPGLEDAARSISQAAAEAQRAGSTAADDSTGAVGAPPAEAERPPDDASA